MSYCRKAKRIETAVRAGKKILEIHVYFQKKKHKNRWKRVFDGIIDCEDIKRDMLDKTVWSCQNNRRRPPPSPPKKK